MEMKDFIFDSADGSESSLKLSEIIVSCLEDHKATDLVKIDLAGKSSIADLLIIGSASSGRQLKALAEKVKEKLHRLGHKSVHIEGLNSTDWVLIDAGDVVTHLFRPEVRDFYGLEKMWIPK